MKILLDESLPRKLRNDFGDEHDVWTVRDKGWLGKKNGELLKLMIDSSFELFITLDRNLPYQQNLDRLPLTICVLYWGFEKIGGCFSVFDGIIAGLYLSKITLRNVNEIRVFL